MDIGPVEGTEGVPSTHEGCAYAVAIDNMKNEKSASTFLVLRIIGLLSSFEIDVCMSGCLGCLSVVNKPGLTGTKKICLKV